ncbi:hypothetical protein FS749_010539 [Ceratobasidium sp. UAMH 11750]|nr:hypothetical protein FS749_010539 [Ceratobasidium sp. UAMH 11750]
MEQFCGALARANKSRCFPYASLDRHVLEIAQLSQIKLIYGLTDVLNLNERHTNIATGTWYDGYPNQVFVRPKRTMPLNSSLRKRVARYLSSVIEGLDERVVRHWLTEHHLVTWGKMQLLDALGGHDVVRGHALIRGGGQCTRDASYVKYHTWFDRLGHSRPRELDSQTLGYGRAEQFIIIDNDFLQNLASDLDIIVPFIEPIVLAIVSPIPTFSRTHDHNLINYRLSGGQLANPEVIDTNDIERLIGRIQASDRTWSIVDRSTVVGRIDMLESMVEAEYEE